MAKDTNRVQVLYMSLSGSGLFHVSPELIRQVQGRSTLRWVDRPLVGSFALALASHWAFRSCAESFGLALARIWPPYASGV